MARRRRPQRQARSRVVAGDHTVHCTGRAAWPSELDGKPVVVAGTLTSRSSPPLPVGPHGERSAGAEGIAWALSPCASPPPGGEGLLDAERALFAAFARRDRDQLERIITPDFVLRIPGEPDLDRAALVRAATTTPGDIVEVTGDRLVAHQAGTLGIVEGIQRARVRLDGKLVEDRRTFVDVFVRRDGAWHVRFALIVSDAAGDPSPRVAAGDLPSLERWRRHVTDELLPFWLTPDALGTPIGNFPTFRCNDGTAFRPQAPCPELARPPDWIASELGRDYTWMKSRQTFLYGVAFHITGEERYLDDARAGATWLRQHAYEPTDSAITYWAGGKAGPPLDQRTTQDLAYAQVGLAFYYYLTRDPDVLVDLLRLERHIMTRYWQPSPDPPGGMLRWALADRGSQWWIFAELDQAAATLALREPSAAPYARYLARSYDCWFTRFVDHRNTRSGRSFPPTGPRPRSTSVHLPRSLTGRMAITRWSTPSSR